MLIRPIFPIDSIDYINNFGYKNKVEKKNKKMNNTDFKDVLNEILKRK